LHGGADTGVQPKDAMAFAQKMGEAGNLYELVIYARDDHAVNLNAEDRLRRTIDWFKNVRKMSIAQPVGKTIREAGIEAAIKKYRELKQSQSRAYDFAELEMNTLGYQLLSEQKVREAIEIFKLNVEAYPQGFNAYDSLGEAYMIIGERQQAIINYKKSLELNGKNANAVEMLQRLTAP
jgi:tetratricopeptide (TPR) repeat protein